MLEQFNDFIESLDEQIDVLNKEIASLENKKQNLSRARRQFIETSKLLNTDEDNIDILKKREVKVIEDIHDENNYIEEISNYYEQIIPEDITPISLERLEITPIEEDIIIPIEVYDNDTNA